MFPASRLVFDLVDDKDWDLSVILLSRNAKACGSLQINFTAIQMTCREFNLAITDKAFDVFGMAL